MATHGALPKGKYLLAKFRTFIPQSNHLPQAQTLHAEVQRESNGEVTEDSKVSGLLLPPIDGGRGAWWFLFGGCMTQAFLWGFALSYGVFQDYYSSYPPFVGNKNISIIGIATAVVYLGALPTIFLMKIWPQHHRHMVWVGWALANLGLIAASFATTVGLLIATQGVLFRVGFTIIYFPLISMLNEWFVLRRGLALGIMQASSGLTGIAMPFALAALLDKYDYVKTLRILAIAIVVLTGPILPVLRGRPPAPQNIGIGETTVSLFRNPLFYFYSASVFLQGLGNFFPTLYLPSYASNSGYEASAGALLLALVSLGRVFGQVTGGYLSDKHVPLSILTFSFPFVSSVCVLTIWGLVRSFPLLAVFSLLYGVFGGGYVVLWAKMGLDISGEPYVALITFGIFSSMRGIGNIITGPISAALLLPESRKELYALGRYKWVVIFCGVSMAMSSGVMVLLVIVRKVKWTSLRGK